MLSFFRTRVVWQNWTVLLIRDCVQFPVCQQPLKWRRNQHPPNGSIYHASCSLSDRAGQNIGLTDQLLRGRMLNLLKKPPESCVNSCANTPNRKMHSVLLSHFNHVHNVGVILLFLQGRKQSTNISYIHYLHVCFFPLCSVISTPWLFYCAAGPTCFCMFTQ